MPLINVRYDTDNARFVGVVSETTASGINDQSYDASEGQTEFVTNVSFGAEDQVDVYVAGRKMREGGSNDFTKNTSTNTITLNEALEGGEWVFIRILISVAAFIDNEFDATEGQTSLDLSQTINGTQTIDVYKSGRIQREGATHDYQRDVANDQIDFNNALNGGEYILVRMYND